jgi:hypothetical protein
MATKVRRDGNTLTIQLSLQEPRVSASGKTLVVATTRGQVNTGIEYEGSDILLVANAYISRPKGAAARESVHPKGRKEAATRT